MRTSLTLQDEMDHLDVGDMKTAMEGAGLLWLHLPIPDTGIPDTGWKQHWRRISPALHQRLEAGGRIVIHCRACLFGGAIGDAIGDALGAEMEFWSLDRIRQTFPHGVDRILPHDGRPAGRDAARAQSHVLAQLLCGTPVEEAVRSLHTLRLDDDTWAAVERAWAAVPDGRPETVETLGQGWVAEEALSMAEFYPGV